MNLFFFKSLRVRLLLLVFVAVIPAWGVIAYTASEQRRIAVVQIQRNVLQLAEFIAHEEEQILQGARQILIALAKFIQKEDNQPSECNAFCADLLKQFRRYANLGAVRPNGKVYCSAVPFNQPPDAADQLWFRRAVETGDFAVGDYHVGRITGKPVLVLSNPAINAAGNTVAVVFAALDLQWLNRHKFDIQDLLPDDFTITQIDENGVVLAHQPKPNKWLERTMPTDSFFQEILAQKKGVIKAPGAQGKPFIYAFAPVHSTLRNRQIYIILGLSERYIFADSNRILIRNLTLLGIVALVAMLAAWFGGDLFILRQVKTMVQASRRLAAGELNTRTGLPYGEDELSQLAKAFDEMVIALEQRQAERLRAETELKRSQELFRNLSTHLQEVREEERTRIARQIHDDLGQALTALKIDISWLNNKLPDGRDIIREKLASMVALIDGTVQTVRKVSEDLRPGILDDFGLPAAIEWQTEEFQKRTGIECKSVFYPDELVLSKEQSTNLFRIVQESLTNVIRHAEATRVEVRINAKEGILILEIQDNGKGISEAATADSRSFGLIGVKERAYSLGGEVTITGVRNEGTCLTVKMPISERKNCHD
jgi:signal transduction histidine kinase